MFLTKQNIQMNKVISHIHYIYIESPFLKKKDWIHTFYNTSLFQFKTLAMQLSLHLI